MDAVSGKIFAYKIEHSIYLSSFILIQYVGITKRDSIKLKRKIY